MIFSIASLVISLIGSAISIFVLFRTLISERVNFEVSIVEIIEAPTDFSDLNYLYIDLIFTNKSKLPISVISVDLLSTEDNDSFSVLEDGSMTTSAKKDPVLTHTRKRMTGSKVKEESKYYSATLPLNLAPLSASNEILAFNIQKLNSRQIKYLKNRLLIKTSRGNLDFPVPKEMGLDIADWIKSR